MLGKFAITVTDDSETSLIIASMSMTAGNAVKYAVVGWVQTADDFGK